MAMYYYASKISAIACGTRCRQTVLQQSRGQRDRDKYELEYCEEGGGGEGGEEVVKQSEECDGGGSLETSTGTRYRRRHSAQLDGYDIAELGFQKLQVSSSVATNSTRTTFTSGSIISNNTSGGYALDQITNQYNDDDTNVVQYDVPKNTFKHSTCDVNYESSVLGAGGIMYINGKIVSGPLDSLIDELLPNNLIDFDKEFLFSFLLSSRLFLRPHELLGKLLSSVPDSESLESLVTLLAEWTNKFPYDYRDERMMSHVKHIVARCSNTCLEAIVSDILSALLNRLTDLEQHEINLRSCQINSDKPEATELFDRATSLQYAQILCRLEKKLAKQVGPEEFLQAGSNVLLDKQKKWDQPSTLFGPPGAQDPKKTCNLETYLDWSARLRLFVCNEILQCAGIHDRSRTVELWSGVAQYCLLVGNYNSATAILETLESPPVARLKITWSKLQVTCQQLDCMQRHAEGHGDLWNKQSIVLNENHQQQNQQKQQQQQLESEQNHYQNEEVEEEEEVYNKTNDHNQQKTDMPVVALLSTSSSTATTVTAATTETDTDTEAATSTSTTTKYNLPIEVVGKIITKHTSTPTTSPMNVQSTTRATTSTDILATIDNSNFTADRNSHSHHGIGESYTKIMTTKTTNCTPIIQPATTTTTATSTKPNDWVVIPVFADIVKLALVAREHCLQLLPNGHINIVAFERMAAIVGAFTKHMQAVKSAAEIPSGEYETFCRHMQKTSKLAESELMMASFNCEEPNNAEKLMYDLN